jgi:hypothetical protein
VKPRNHDRITFRYLLTALVAVGVLVVLMDIVQFRLEERMAQSVVVAQEPMTPYEQCQIWNKQSFNGVSGACPGDLQPRWYR